MKLCVACVSLSLSSLCHAGITYNPEGLTSLFQKSSVKHSALNSCYSLGLRDDTSLIFKGVLMYQDVQHALVLSQQKELRSFRLHDIIPTLNCQIVAINEEKLVCESRSKCAPKTLNLVMR